MKTPGRWSHPFDFLGAAPHCRPPHSMHHASPALNRTCGTPCSQPRCLIRTLNLSKKSVHPRTRPDVQPHKIRAYAMHVGDIFLDSPAFKTGEGHGDMSLASSILVLHRIEFIGLF
jgi:hypothetical protein